MYIAAHEDDTLLFQSPSLLQDIQSEHCVRTVFLTAGDAGRAQSYWGMREDGVEDGYAQMAGVANQWTGSQIIANGHSIHLETLKARPGISIAYMRLPDGGTNGLGFPLYGNQSLMKLWNSENQDEEDDLPEITSIKANDNSATYGYGDLITTLNSVMTAFGPQQIYTQNYTVNLISADHPDHVATGLFVREASRAYAAAHRLVGFRDYETSGQAQNVTGTLLGGKSAAFYKYGAHDSDACASEGACTGTEYAKWLLRQYMVSSTKFETKGVVANAGFTQLTEPNTPITLDGSGSSVEAGKTAQYSWTQTGGPAVTLSSTVASKPTFTTPSHPTKLTFSLVVKDGTTTSKPDTVVVKAPSSDPTPTAIAGPTQTVASGAKVTLNGSESWDPNSATLQYSWLQTAGPVVTLTGSSTATPSFTAPTGPTSVKFSLVVSNGNQTSAPSTVTINVNGTVPTFTSSSAAAFTTGVAGSFKVTTTASPTAALSRSEGELPPGLAFGDNGDGTATITGTPTAAAAPAGSSQAYPVKVKATNSQGSESQTLTITVTNPGTAPLFTSGTSGAFTTGVAGSFTVSSSGDPLPNVTKSAGTLPSGVSVTTNANGTLTISGTPAASAAEPGQSRGYPLTFKAQNAAGQVSQSFTLTVTNPGTVPAFTSAKAASFTTGVAASFVVSTSGAPAAAISKVSGSLPAGVSFADQGDGSAKISGTPTGAAAPPGESQDYAVGLKAENGAGSATQTLTITVSNPGTVPTFSSAAATGFTTGVAGSFTVASSAIPTATVTKTSGALPSGVSVTTNANGTLTISGTPAASAAEPGQSQAYALTFKAQNGAGQASQSFTLTVTNPGTVPAFTSDSSASFTTGAPSAFTVAASGIPAAAISKTAGSLPPGLTLVDQGNGSAKLSGTATNAAAPPGESQDYVLALKAVNGAGSANQTLTVTVSNPGTPPSFTSGAAAAFTTGANGSFTVSTSGAPTAAISKTAGALPPGLTLADQGNGSAKLSGTATNAAAPPGESQEYEVTLKAQSLAGSANQTLTITVTNPGTAPAFTSAAATGFTTGVAASFTVATSGDPTATVTKTAGTLPTGVSFAANGDGTATISGTPAASAAEPGKSQGYGLSFKAQSAAGQATQSFALTVTNPGTAPAFTSANAASFTTGSLGSFTIATSGAPAAAIAKTAGALPPGLTLVDQGDGSAKLSGTPSNAAAPPGDSQEYVLALKAENVAGNAGQTLTVTVSNPGTPPSFTSGAAAAFTTGANGSFTVSTSGAPTAAISKTAGALPPGLSLTDNGDGTATLAGTPSAAAASPASSQAYPLTLKAQSLAGSANQTLTVTVTNPGTAPTFTSAASASFTTGSAGSFTVTTAGEPTAALSKTAGSLPTGVSFAANGDGTATISGMPAAAAAEPGKSQSYAITIQAESGAGKATQSFSLKVTNPGTPPTFTSASSTTFTTGVARSFTVSTASNPVAALARSGALPAGLSFSDNGDGTATISGTATNATAPPAGSQAYPLTIEATALSGSKSQSFTLTVANPGTPPAFTSASSTGFTTGVPASFKVSVTGAPTPALGLTGSGELPSGVALVDNGDGSATISGTAPASAAPPSSSKNYPVTIQAQSGAGKSTQTFTLTVTNPGNSPTITSASSTGFTTGVAAGFEITSTGTPTAALTQTGELPAGVSFSDKGDGRATISGTPSASAAPAAASRNYPLTIKAANGAGTITQAFTLTVTNPGAAPKIASSDAASFTTGVAASFEITSSGDPHATLSRTGTLPSGLAFTNKGDGTATIAGTAASSAAPPASSQSYPVTIKALNGAGEVTQALTLTVVNPGVAPTITSAAAASFTTGVAGSFKITSTGSPTAALTRIDGELPDGLAISDKGDGTATISGTPAASAAPAAGSKPYPLTIKASSAAGSKTQVLTLTVSNPGVKPAISSGNAASFTTGTAGSFKVLSSGDPTAALTQTGELPSGVSFTDGGNGTAMIAGTPAASAAPAGSSQAYPLTIKATNGAGSVSQGFTLTVTNPGTGPSITSAASTSFTTGVEASFEITSTGAPAAVLTLDAGALPPGLAFSAKGNGRATISGTPTAAAAAPGTSQDYPLALKAQSSVGSVKQDFTLTVVNPGVAPTITSADSASFTTGSPASFEITTSGDPSPALNKQTGNLPDGLAFKDDGDGTATISGTAAASAAAPGKTQSYPLTLRAKSAAGESTQSLTLTVVNTEAGPVFTSPASASFTTGSAQSFTVSTLGKPAAALAKTGSLPQGLAFKDNGDGTATISGTAAAAAAAPGTSQDYPLTIEASSGAGKAAQSLTLTVVNPEAPVVAPSAEEPRAGTNPPTPPSAEPPVTTEPVRVTLSQGKVLLPIGRYSRRVVQVTAPTQALVTCKGKLPTGARCRVAAQRRIVIEASKAVKRTGTFHLTIHVDDQDRMVRRRLTVQLLAPDDPALKLSRPRPQG
jgi:LmbE family N-acetylglucosaminyl deacetylase